MNSYIAALLRTRKLYPRDLVVRATHENLMMLQVDLRPRLGKRSIPVKALLDSGATGNFIHHHMVNKHHMKAISLPREIQLRNADDTENVMGKITHKVYLAMNINGHTEVVKFFITDLGHDDLILGHTWLYQHNPVVNWRENKLNFYHCPPLCQMSMTDKWRKSSYFPALIRAGIRKRNSRHRPLRQTTQSTEFAAAENQKKAARTMEEMVPPHYLEF